MGLQRLLLLYAATQEAAALLVDALDASTVAMQLSAKPAGRRPPVAGSKPVNKRHRILAGDDHNMTIWIEGDPGTIDCPDIRGAVPVTQDECRAIVLMASPNPVFQAIMNPTWPISVPMFPPGCSMMLMPPFGAMLSWNTHPIGAGNMQVLPVCKEPKYTLYAGGQCPAGMVTFDQAECQEAAEDYHYEYDAQVNPISHPGMSVGCFGKDGNMHFSVHSTGTPGDMDSFNLCKPAPTLEPTPAPTPAPPSGGISGTGGSSMVTATGDPHMTTILGARFDIVRPGNYTFLHIPQSSNEEDALVHVRAHVKHEGVACLDMYIAELHMHGHWVDDLEYGGMHFFANEGPEGAGDWMTFGQLDLKVVHGRTSGGVRYLNLLARHLKKVPYPIGGILGLDDFTHAATPEDECKKKMTLLSLLSSK